MTWKRGERTRERPANPAFIRGPIPHFIAIRNRKGDDDDDDNDDDDNADNDDNDADNDDDNADIVNSVIFTNHSL